jgi:hypothetical protein
MSNFKLTEKISNLPYPSTTTTKIFNTDDLKNISLFIPRVFNNITEETIIDVFENQMSYGKVNHIDFVNIEDKNYKRVFIHFDYWFPTKNSLDIQDKLLFKKEESVKVHYDILWYWLVVLNKLVPQKQNILITYEDLMNMKEIQSIIDDEKLQPEYDALFYGIENEVCEEYEEYKEYEEYEEYEEYDSSYEYNEDDYKKMNDLMDSYFINDDEIDLINRDYVDLIEIKNYNLIINYNILWYNYINSLNSNLYLQSIIHFNQQNALSKEKLFQQVQTEEVPIQNIEYA